MFMRHGKAVSKEEAGGIDEDRWLSSEGRKQVEEVAKLLPQKPSRIYTSPLRRAVETAEIVSKIHGGIEIVKTEILKPGAFICRGLARFDPEPGSILIGHSPNIEEVVSCIVCGGRIKLAAGAVAVVEVRELEYCKGVLVEIIHPRIAEKK